MLKTLWLMLAQVLSSVDGLSANIQHELRVMNESVC